VSACRLNDGDRHIRTAGAVKDIELQPMVGVKRVVDLDS